MSLDVLHSGGLVYFAVIHYLDLIRSVLHSTITTAGTGNLLLSVCVCASFHVPLL